VNVGNYQHEINLYTQRLLYPKITAKHEAIKKQNLFKTNADQP